LIPFGKGYNGDQHTIHMFCDVSKMNRVDPMPTKGCALTWLQNFVELVENTWKCKVGKFHLDGETALKTNSRNGLLRRALQLNGLPLIHLNKKALLEGLEGLYPGRQGRCGLRLSYRNL
jgi:hypothetical protein